MKSKVFKALAVTVSALLLVTAAVFSTIAYLQSKDSVINTFTIGKVAITLDESNVDQYGNVQTGEARVKSNTYKLIPGSTYTKDPVIHFAAGSEASYVFFKMKNEISGIEASGDDIIDYQIFSNGWIWLDNEADGAIFYKQVDANTGSTAIDLPIFSSFTIAATADVSSYDQKSIKITAYAIQSAGIETAAQAWEYLNQ